MNPHKGRSGAHRLLRFALFALFIFAALGLQGCIFYGHGHYHECGPAFDICDAIAESVCW